MHSLEAPADLAERSLARERWTWAPWAVLALIWGIAVLDFVTGVRLMSADTPWLQNSHESLWNALPPAAQASDAVQHLLRALYSRLGAFSIYASLVSAIWGWLSRRERRWRTALLLTYTAAGVPLAYVDHAFFAGTPYLMLKNVIGTLWVAALLLHFASRPSGSERP